MTSLDDLRREFQDQARVTEGWSLPPFTPKPHRHRTRWQLGALAVATSAAVAVAALALPTLMDNNNSDGTAAVPTPSASHEIVDYDLPKGVDAICYAALPNCIAPPELRVGATKLKRISYTESGQLLDPTGEETLAESITQSDVAGDEVFVLVRALRRDPDEADLHVASSAGWTSLVGRETTQVMVHVTGLTEDLAIEVTERAPVSDEELVVAFYERVR